MTMIETYSSASPPPKTNTNVITKRRQAASPMIFSLCSKLPAKCQPQKRK